ncbi:glycine zipper 2TM domain-containing protein [Shewanella salipaludis]|uniref:Glycine zipper 2TM domain-containing protein n=1 Tax=Shewanella salipaludis TaxID=2723052 RepID=A0A972FX13_9GAMM|nr:glycine zipper 2TM domain-containing protein [Shewanella salipaludis]NMH64217.1 glycine zipper 2TM domain-containing protein [Shewanella salipaludis]
MLKPALVSFVMIFLTLLSPVHADYERNRAVPVEKVVYGTLDSVRQLTESQLVEDSHNGWRTFGGALLGGVVGHQFGSGTGRDVATVLGALLGAGMGSRYGEGQYYRQLQLVELLIDLEDGTRVMVIQDLDPGMVFNAGDEVRVVYLQGGVRVDLAM